MLHRRTFLAAGVATVTSGCSTALDGREKTTTTVTIGILEISNSDDSPHEAELELYADGELVYEDVHTLGSGEEGDGVVIVERDWPANVGQYTLRGRFDDRAWRSFVFDEPHSKTCHVAKLHFSTDGDYDIYTATAGADESLC